MIIDAKYQLFGEAIMIGLAEAISILMWKKFDQAARLDVAVLDSIFLSRSK